MGIFDSFLGDLQRDIRKVTNGVDVVKSGARKVVDAIDTAEDKLNNLPSEDEIKQKVKQSLKTVKPTPKPDPKSDEEPAS